MWPAEIDRMGTVYGVALNYRAERDALAQAFTRPPHGEPPRTPVLFVKTPNTLCGPGAPVHVPPGVAGLEPGPALAVEIGCDAHRLTPTTARGVIAGYRVANDVSLPGVGYYRPAIGAKCRDGFCPLSASPVAAAEVGDPRALGIRLYVDDVLRQSGTTRDWVDAVTDLLVFMSGFMTLRSGDIILTGTPAGRVTAGPGAVMRVEIDRVGSLTNPLVRA